MTTLAAVTERRSVALWVPLARGRPIVIATRATFGVLSRRAIAASIVAVFTARTVALPLKRSLPVASGVGNLFLPIIAGKLTKLSAIVGCVYTWQSFLN